MSNSGMGMNYRASAYDATNERLTVQNSDGSKHLVKHIGPVYAHTKVGDRVRIHTALPYPVELYDKAAAGALYGSFCGQPSPLTATRCTQCDRLLLR